MSGSAFRVLDANVNRCSEALRVLEDHFRFVRGNRNISLSLKQIRHELFRIVSGRLRSWRPYRDVEGDLNKNEDFAPEDAREYLIDRNCSRVKESLRVLEETLKGVESKMSLLIRALRFLFYELEPRLMAASNAALEIVRKSRLYLILSTEHYKSERLFLKLARIAVDSGIRLVQYRDNLFTRRERLRHLNVMRKITASARALLVVNDHVGLCFEAGCDGIHVGRDDLPPDIARQVLGPDRIIGGTCHSLREIKSGNKDLSDYLSYGTFFTSRTKPRPVLPRKEWSSIKKGEKPCFAVGGITVAKAALLAGAGIKRIAVCSEVMLAANPRATVQKLLRITGG